MDPINYLGMAPQDSFLRNVAGGFQLGNGIRQVQQEQQAAQAAALQAQQEAAQYQADVDAFNAKPSAQAAAALALKWPKQREVAKQAWDQQDAAQRKSQGDAALQVGFALESGNKDAAKSLLQDRIAALNNSGMDSSHEKLILGAIDTHPDAVRAELLKWAAFTQDPEKFAQNYGKIGDELRAQALHGDVARKGSADASTAEADLATKNLGIVAQKAGALAGAKDLRPSQVETFFRSEAAAGRIPKDQLQGYLDGIPTDPKALRDYLGSIRDQGIKPDDQKKFVTPTADARLSSETQITTTRMNNKNQLDVQDAIAKRTAANQQFKVTHGIAGLSDAQNEALFGENGAVTTGRLDPNKINSKTATIFADAELKNPGTNFAKLSSDVNSGRKADAEFTTGKAGNAIRSFNVGLTHLDTLNSLADALNNRNMKAFNQVSNLIATQTGQPAPTNFGAAKKIVGDELVKAIVGAGGTGHDREEVARTIDAANSPAQLKGAIKTVQELMVGQLGGLEQQYRTTTKRDDFEKFLSPRALEIRKSHGGAHAAAAPSLPSGWSVEVH